MLALTNFPEPPSANRWWRLGRSGPRGRGHHIHRSADATAYLSALRILIGAGLGVQARFPLFRKLVVVRVEWYRSRKSGDLDKRLGVLLDALQGTVYDNDADVVELHAYRFDRPTSLGLVDIYVKEAARDHG